MITVKKRNGSVEQFDEKKLYNAVLSCLERTSQADKGYVAQTATEHVVEALQTYKEYESSAIMNMVRDALMDMKAYDAAQEFILYRNSHKPDIFRKRVEFKPVEYPVMQEYVDAIRHSYWIHTEFNYSSDIQDMKANMSASERQVAERAMLAISQIEVAVKTFWAKIGDKFPKPEVQAVAATFSESEVRHADAYSNLLEIMGLNDQFSQLKNVPAIQKRIEYLERAIATPVDDRDYFYNIILFSMLIENVSLFSQFFILLSMNKHKGYLKGIANAVQSTSLEEDIHAKFGFELVNIIKTERPDWWTAETTSKVKALVDEAYQAEVAIVHWIFESYTESDIYNSYIIPSDVWSFLSDRIARTFEAVGIEQDKYKRTSEFEWFDVEITATKEIDFFNKKSSAYNKRSKSITAEDLF